MKRCIIITILSCAFGIAEARQQESSRLIEIHESNSNKLYFTLYWHPDSREIFQEKIPSSKHWVGFETALWRIIPKEKKLALLKELDANLNRMEIKERNEWWARHNDWHNIHTQLSLIATFLRPDTEAGFVEFAFQDPTLRPGLQWILDIRGPEFDSKHVGSTLASGEHVRVFPKLVEHLIDIPEKQRLECFSRLLAKIAEGRATEVE